MSERERRGSLVGPAILIALGVILLLNNLGVLAWSVWDVMFRLWPILLIAVGLDLIVGHRSIWGSLVGLAVLLAVLAGALWLFSVDIGGRQRGAAEEITQALGSAERAEVTIHRGSGSLRIQALPESANLIEGVFHPSGAEKIARNFALSDGTATLTLRSDGTSWGPFAGGPRDVRTWHLGMTPGVPLRLNVNLGVGESDIDLSGLMIQDFRLSMGVGQATVILPDRGRFQAKIEGAIGETVVVIPESMGARVHFSTALVNRDVPSGYQARDDVYVSPTYDSAEGRVDLEVGQAIGRVAIRHSAAR
jgi:hypothetical protein